MVTEGEILVMVMSRLQFPLSPIICPYLRSFCWGIIKTFNYLCFSNYFTWQIFILDNTRWFHPVAENFNRLQFQKTKERKKKSNINHRENLSEWADQSFTSEHFEQREQMMPVAEIGEEIPHARLYLADNTITQWTICGSTPALLTYSEWRF